MTRISVLGRILAVTVVCLMLGAATHFPLGLSYASSLPSIIDTGLTSQTKLWPPQTYLEATPGEVITAWCDIAYSGPRITVKIKTTIIDPYGSEISDPLGDPWLVLMEDMPEHTGWVGDDFEIPDTATLGTYDVKFSVLSEDGTHEYDSTTKSGWLRLSLPEPDIRTPINSIDFGSVIVGNSLDESTTIYNDGSATLTINSIARTGSSDFAYISPSTPFNVGAGSWRTVTISFAPSSEGSKSATFTVNSNDPDEGSVTFNALGSGTTAPEPDIRTPINPIDFGSVIVGNSLDESTTIYNDGSATLTINSIARTGSSDFAYISPSTPFNIGAGSSRTITISFAPSSEGSKSATFTVNSNDPDEAGVTFNALGGGTTVPEPDIRTPINSIDFGSVIVGNSLDESTAIYNDGNATLTISSIARTSGSSDFTYVSPSTPFNIGAGGSRTITISFAPSSEGSKSATFTVNSNDPDEGSVTFNALGSGVIRIGSINVNSDPSGAFFTLIGPASYSGTTPWSTTNAPVGTYTITWGAMSGYTAPPPETKSLMQGGTITFYGSYVPLEETISTPDTPSGSTSGITGTSYAYSTGGATSSLGHSLQYRFDWGDGSYSSWSSSTSASHSWSSQGTYTVRAQARCATHISIVSSWSGGKSMTMNPPSPTSVPCFDGQTCYSSKEEAISSVPDHVVPKECFVWNDGPPGHPWRVIPGYGCAHWVAHELSITTGATCYDGYSIRVRDVIAGLTEVGIQSCKVGDIWTNSDETHCGIVRQLGDGKVLVEHCSSAQGGVVTGWFSSGKCWSESLMPEAEAFPGANAGNLWEYYSAWGKELPLLTERAKIYEALGLGSATSYAGTAEQNTRLLNTLKDRRICPSTADEISGVAPETTIARLIEQETQERTTIIVDGEEYYTVTLKRYIEPEKLQPFAEPSGWKVYVDSAGEPISDEDIVQQISLVKKANYIMSNIGSPVGVSDTLQMIDEVLAAHEDLTGAEMVTFIAKELAFITVDVAFVAGTGGTATPLISQRVSGIILDFGKRYTDPARLRADLGSGLLDAAKGHYKEADRISREQWAVTLRIDESGELALEQENFTRVTDALRAAEFLEHFYTAYLMEVYGTGLILPAERINKNTLYEILGWVPEYIGDKISGNILSIFQLGKNLMEYPSSLEEYLQRINSMSSQVEELMVEPGRSAQYTLALAHRDISFLKEVPLKPYIYAHVASPVELRVHDSKGNTTGVIGGEIRIDIPRSYYSGGAVIIFSPSDSYEYEVAGTSEGSYDLYVTTVAEQTDTFALTSVPTSARVVHQYTIDWNALSEGGKGVTMKIDSDGDGSFERVIHLSGIEEGKEGLPTWVWISIGVVTGFAVAFVVWRRMGKKGHAKA